MYPNVEINFKLIEDPKNICEKKMLFPKWTRIIYIKPVELCLMYQGFCHGISREQETPNLKNSGNIISYISVYS